MVKLTRFSGIAILALLTASCSDRDVGDGDAIATPERALPEIVDNLLPKGFGTQDFLLHLDLQVLNEVEEGESIYQQVLDKAKEGAGEATPLFDGILFRPTDSIRGIVRDTGTRRERCDGRRIRRCPDGLSLVPRDPSGARLRALLSILWQRPSPISVPRVWRGDGGAVAFLCLLWGRCA